VSANVERSGKTAEPAWYELAPGNLTVRQAGTIASSGRYVFNAAISPARDGTHAMIDFNLGG
jgi:hypothetical protein